MSLIDLFEEVLPNFEPARINIDDLIRERIPIINPWVPAVDDHPGWTYEYTTTNTPSVRYEPYTTSVTNEPPFTVQVTGTLKTDDFLMFDGSTYYGGTRSRRKK